MGRTIGESEPAWPAPLRAKEGAPNVLFIVLDDTGFGQFGCYGSPTSPDYGPKNNTFNGEIAWVQIDVGKDDHNHLISPEERFRIAMARQ